MTWRAATRRGRSWSSATPLLPSAARPARGPSGGRGASGALAGAVTAALLASVPLADGIRHGQDRREVAEASSLRVAVTAARVRPGVVGVPGAPVQDGPVEVELRNDGPAPLRVLEVGLDGGAPFDTGPRQPVAPGERVSVVARWRVRCAEIGELGGPRALVLKVRARTGAVHLLRVPFPSYDDPTGPARTFRAAGVQACQVLVR